MARQAAAETGAMLCLQLVQKATETVMDDIRLQHWYRAYVMIIFVANAGLESSEQCRWFKALQRYW